MNEETLDRIEEVIKEGHRVWIRDNQIMELVKEVRRLKAGWFTPEELQNLCHNLSKEECKAFCKGCLQYQKSLFGEGATVRFLSNEIFYAMQEVCWALDRASYCEALAGIIIRSNTNE